MSAEISIGILFVVMGLVFVLIPLEHLKKAFPRMRYSYTTKLGGAALLIAGLGLIISRLTALHG